METEYLDLGEWYSKQKEFGKDPIKEVFELVGEGCSPGRAVDIVTSNAPWVTSPDDFAGIIVLLHKTLGDNFSDKFGLGSDPEDVVSALTDKYNTDSREDLDEVLP
jgi:hypothetical protein